ncbi:MAG: hypothetical protein AAGA54_32170 [Myxococcota bacterium]
MGIRGGARWCALVGALSLAGCASGDGQDGAQTFGPGVGSPQGDDTGGNWWTEGPPPESDTTGGGFTSAPDSEGEGDEDPGLPPDLGACQGPADCVIEDSTCFVAQGACVAGACMFDPKPAGAACVDPDPCTVADACDGFGACAGDPMDCGTGECVGGQCSTVECGPGTADCNGDAVDGCEVSLNSDDNCGECGNSCNAGPNATGACMGNSCEYSCDAGFGNCDGDWSNGCEIPLGANQCDIDGLNPNGCWTSHCGSSTNADAVNFGTWYCFDCTTCNVPSPGMCRWCNHDTGNWFPAESCACGSFEDLACSP